MKLRQIIGLFLGAFVVCVILLTVIGMASDNVAMTFNSVGYYAGMSCLITGGFFLVVIGGIMVFLHPIFSIPCIVAGAYCLVITHRLL